MARVLHGIRMTTRKSIHKYFEIDPPFPHLTAHIYIPTAYMKGLLAAQSNQMLPPQGFMHAGDEVSESTSPMAFHSGSPDTVTLDKSNILLLGPTGCGKRPCNLTLTHTSISGQTVYQRDYEHNPSADIFKARLC